MVREEGVSGWRLRSSNGLSELSCWLHRGATQEVIADFSCRSEQLESSRQALAEVVGVLLSERALRDLVTKVADFVERPFADIDLSELSIDSDLAELQNEEARIKFGLDPSVVLGSLGVGARVSVRRDAFSCVLVSKTDLTAITTMAQELQDSLNEG